jgi:hypothetical protein
VIKVALDKRSFFEQSAAVGGTPLSRAELAELATLDAAAAIIQYAVSAGQEADVKGKAAPNWVLQMAAQARTALVAEETEVEA